MTVDDSFSEARQLLMVEQRLMRRFASDVPPAVVRQVIRQHAVRFDSAPVRLYVPLLIERAASLDLDAARSRAA